MFNRRFTPTAVIVLALLASPALAQQACEKLNDLKLPYTTVTSSVVVPEGPISAPRGGQSSTAPTAPARCEVKGVMRPTPDSDIKFAVWLPVSGWNGKYTQVGNGGWAGNIPYGAMIDPLRRGYATAGTDDGHEGGTGA